jgi:hypothetical protein
MPKKPVNAFKKILAESGQAPKKGKPAKSVEQFVGRGVAAQRAVDALTKPAAAEQRRMKPGYVQVGANIPRELKVDVFKRLQDLQLEGSQTSFSSLVEDLLQEWIDKG